jgi:hypothetical protein
MVKRLVVVLLLTTIFTTTNGEIKDESGNQGLSDQGVSISLTIFDTKSRATSPVVGVGRHSLSDIGHGSNIARISWIRTIIMILSKYFILVKLSSFDHFHTNHATARPGA